MSQNWLNAMRNGTKPSELLAQEMSKSSELARSQLVSEFLDRLIAESGDDLKGRDIQQLYFAIWKWKKPGQKRNYGISTEHMDDWILKLLVDWGLLEADSVGIKGVPSKRPKH